MHEGEFELRQHRDGTTTFLRPYGTPMEAAPALSADVARLDVRSIARHDIPVWDGTPFDAAHAIDVLYRPSVPGDA